MTTDQQLPLQAIEAEMSILGGIFVDNEIIDAVHGAIEVNDFYRESHRLIFLAMSRLSNRNEPIDLITTSTELKNAGSLEQVGGAAYLAILVDFVPMAANTLYYCRIVAQRALQRRLVSDAQEAIQIIYRGGEMEEAVAKLERAVQPAIGKESSAPVGMEQAVREAIKRVERRHETRGTVQGLPYGLKDLDKATSGMHPGEFIVIGGRPSMGKSAFAGNVLANAGASGKSALLFTLEMSRGDIIDRMAAGHGIKYQSIRTGQLKEIEWSYLTKAMSEIHGWRLAIDDTPAISLRDLRAKARRQKKEGLDLVVVDYLQLMSVSNPKDNRVQGLGEISRGFKQLARELDIPVVVLSQLSREVEKRNDKRPMMSDLRDSGEIEQDADVIIFPYRPAVYCQKCKDRVDDGQHNYREHQAKAELIIEKQRAGERNVSIPACWLGEYQKFEGV